MCLKKRRRTDSSCDWREDGEQVKTDHRMGRNHLAGSFGYADNAILAAAGYNFRRLLARLAFFCALLSHTLRVHKPQLTA
jgi:IS5 family transposase